MSVPPHDIWCFVGYINPCHHWVYLLKTTKKTVRWKPLKALQWPGVWGKDPHKAGELGYTWINKGRSSWGESMVNLWLIMVNNGESMDNIWYIWVNCNDLTVLPNPGIMVYFREIIPKWPQDSGWWIIIICPDVGNLFLWDSFLMVSCFPEDRSHILKQWWKLTSPLLLNKIPGPPTASLRALRQGATSQGSFQPRVGSFWGRMPRKLLNCQHRKPKDDQWHHMFRRFSNGPFIFIFQDPEMFRIITHYNTIPLISYMSIVILLY